MVVTVMMNGNNTLIKREFELNKQYIFPHNIKEVFYKGKRLVISVDYAKWIVLENSDQYQFYNLLQTYSIALALEEYDGDIKDAKYVITQIEGRHFTDTNVISCIDSTQQVLHVYLTNSCNLKCPHCYMYAGMHLENELTTDEIKSMLSSYRGNGGKKVTLSGGEISLRKDLLDIVRHAYNCGLSVRLLTNGTLWTSQLIDSISPLINSVQISIDGFDEKSNSKVRGCGNFDKSMTTLERFIDNGISTEIAITPFYDIELESYIEHYAQFAKHLSQKYKRKNFSIKFANQILEGRAVRLTCEQQRQYNDIINHIYSIFYEQDIAEYPFIACFSKPIIMNNCMYGELSISANGNVYFCSRIPSMTPVTNIRDMSFGEIMNLSKRAQQKSDISNLRPCCDCELKYICGGGCRIDFFPSFVHCKDVISKNVEDFGQRMCDNKDKERFYDLMIKTNSKLFY